ncbi:MAG TPA: SIS domain-containing protein [Symbiobacteriaceae bacterium]|nr:SIS domain-containing protein [Symbiobacteriaceae bacterium]
MMLSAPTLFDEARKAIDKLEATQMANIRKAGEILAGAIQRDGVVQVFGTGHSRAFAMEMANRAGGLVPMNAIDMTDLFLRQVVPITLWHSPELERDPAVAHKILALYNLRPADAFIIVSNSGRNGSTVEMAMQVKKHGHPLIVVTSMDHTTQVTSRHPSGKKLYELADVVIDNCGPFGDALLPLDDHGFKACAISSITGAFIAQGLTAEIIGCLQRAGAEIPVLISANVDGGDAHNDALRARYAGRIGGGVGA